MDLPVVSSVCYFWGEGMLTPHWLVAFCRPKASLLTAVIITLLINLVNCMNPVKVASRKQTQNLIFFQQEYQI